MNAVELLVYNAVKRNAVLKRLIRDIYQRITVVVTCSWMRRFSSQYQIDAREKCFFGYYDKSPWSHDDRYFLAHHFDIPLRMPLKSDTVEIRCYQGNEYSVLGKTYAWNWQQGAMLQWVGQSHCVLFNDYSGMQHIARIVGRNGNEVKILHKPIAALSADGTYAASYSFERLRYCAPGYAYMNGNDPHINDPAPSGDGLWFVDVESGAFKLAVSLSEISAFAPEASMSGSYHYINHAAFSPSGSKVVFFHRWQLPNREWTRMFTYDRRDGKLYLFDTSGMVSHFTWRDEDHILAWARLPERKNDAYVLFTDGSKERIIIGEDLFTSDGHPSFSPDKRYILMDTYPDRARVSNLILYDSNVNDREDIAKLYNPFCYNNDLRCDLHPRWNRTGTAVAFDAVYSGTRSLCTIQLDSKRYVSKN
ncbi:MAG: hypothetical protein Q7S48_03210 [bacterium]|nr:hypothetical protein [bacterium]